MQAELRAEQPVMHFDPRKFWSGLYVPRALRGENTICSRIGV